MGANRNVTVCRLEVVPVVGRRVNDGRRFATCYGFPVSTFPSQKRTPLTSQTVSDWVPDSKDYCPVLGPIQMPLSPPRLI